MKKIITRPMKASFIGLAALILAALPGVFAETTNTVDASRIVVTATRRAAPIRSVANNPSVITAEDIEAGRYTSVPEALQKKAGLFFRNISDNPSRAAVDLRGFGGDAPFGRTLVLLNGRKLNRPDMATINWGQIPMQAVERIEVIRGPNSVLYGDSAVGGVINIITKEATETPQTSLLASAGSYEAYEQSLTTSGTLKGLGYVATVGHQSGDGYRDRSKYDTLSGSLRLSGNITDDLSAYTEISAIKGQYQLPGALTRDQMNMDRRQSVNPDDSATEEFFNVQGGIEALLGDEVVLNLDGGFSRKGLDANFPSFWTPTYYDYKINTYTFSPKVTVLSPIFDHDNELVFGVDWTKETLNTKTFTNVVRKTVVTDTKSEKQVVGIYIADTFNLTDNLLLSGGYRWEENQVDTRHKGGYTPYDESKTHREDVWQGAITWLPTDTLKVFAGVAQTFRYPFFDEQAIYSGWGDGFNKDLEPETGINYEAGIEFMPLTNLTLQATVFYTEMEDEIVWGGSGNTNLDETVHSGVELSAAYTHEYFAIDAFYTWLRSEFTEGLNEGNEIPWVPQNMLDVNLALFLSDALTLNTHMSYVGSMFQSGDNSNSGANKQSEYVLVDLLLQYELPTDNIEATVFAGIDNIFGTEYNHLVAWDGYYPAPERTFKAGLSVTF